MFYEKDKSSRPKHAEISSSLRSKKIIVVFFFFQDCFFQSWNMAKCVHTKCVRMLVHMHLVSIRIHKKNYIFFSAAQFSFFFLLSVLEHGGQAAVKWLDTKDIVEGWGGVTDENPSRLDASFLVAVHTNIFFVFLGGV